MIRPPHSYVAFTKQDALFSQVKLNTLFSYKGVKYRKVGLQLAKPPKGEAVVFAQNTKVTIAENKHGAIQVFADPKNHLSHRLERDTVHTLRFPSKYEYRVYCGLMDYLIKVNKNYPNPRYFLEMQFTITLIAATPKVNALKHVVDFVIRDSQSRVNPVWYIEAKGQCLPEYLIKMTVMKALKPNVYDRYLIISDKEPPDTYTSYYSTLDRLEKFLHTMGVK
jgi:hypothetical protein